MSTIEGRTVIEPHKMHAQRRHLQDPTAAIGGGSYGGSKEGDSGDVTIDQRSPRMVEYCRKRPFIGRKATTREGAEDGFNEEVKNPSLREGRRR